MLFWEDNRSMMRLQFRTLLACAAIALATEVAIAKIAPLKPVAPVESNGVRYAADRDGRDQYVIATDIATGKQLWKVRVFHTHIKFWIEEDVQWIFITDLKLVDNSLFVRDGKARCYTVDIKTRRVRKIICPGVFGQQESSTQWRRQLRSAVNCPLLINRLSNNLTRPAQKWSSAARPGRSSARA